MMLRPQGMGVLYKADSEGHVIDCDSWSNVFQGVCWNPFASEVVPAAPAVNPDGSPAPAVPAVPTPVSTSAFGTFGQPLLMLAAGGLIAMFLLSRGRR
jgi:hypothetical protein